MTGHSDFTSMCGEWSLELDATPGSFEFRHTPTAASLDGTLAFEVETSEGPVGWAISPARDGIRDRLSLLDPKGNVRGYITFTSQGGVLRIAVLVRPPRSALGALRLRAKARMGRRAFACRTIPPASSRVVQMASGLADSRLNDSIFDPDTDAVMRLGGLDVRIAADRRDRDLTRFDVLATARTDAPGNSILTVEVERDFYRRRYAPCYRPIDKGRCPSPPTGWMSWNVYFDQAGEEENLAEARVAAERLRPFGLEVWSIESWQENSATQPVRDFHHLTLRPHPGQFPHGMKWLADEIRALGFLPGIWTVPFGTGDRAFYESHREWFLHDKAGNPMGNWCGRYVLDPSQEAVRRHMEETHRLMSREWGYEFFKIDGMSGSDSHYSAHFYERSEVREAFKETCEAPYALCVEALRRGIGDDRVLLACQGHFTGADVAYADAARTGADVVGVNRPPAWHNVVSQAHATLAHLFVHNILFYTDPDTLLVGEALPLSAARIATSVVGLPGQVMFAGDKLADLPDERMWLLQRCLPVCDVRPLDLFPIRELSTVWDLKIHRAFDEWDVVALVNRTDEEVREGITFGEIGLDPDGSYLVYEYWSGACWGVFTGEVTTDLPGRTSVLLGVRPLTGRLQIASVDRHLTQGGVCLESVAWDEARSELSGMIRLVGGEQTVVTVYVPEGYGLVSVQAEADGASSSVTVDEATRTAALALRCETSGTAEWRLRA